MKVEVTIPTELRELTLGQYIEFIKFQETEQNETKLRLKALEVFCGLSNTDSYNIPYNEVLIISNVLFELLNLEPTELIQTFKVKDVEFGFIPDLESISFGEYIDIDTSLQNVETFDKAMAVLYRPIKKKIGNLYEIEEYAPNKYSMLNMPLDVALSSIFFLFNLGMELSQATMNYLQVEEIQEALNEHLRNNQDGMAQFTNSLKEILQRLNISLN